ncbi:tyrosine/serine phosphatase-like protein [Amylocarpus encephaloides]|uniref:Tyrosine/serine phosphatase-like protein n=1 Tax=Amylocarpus encephaloides TaxID=45428 RepID=A0A9P8C2V2_9HELO|nr:tyrosine/serine phosphatase-like protein [Amylocarpus encephaloides]
MSKSASSTEDAALPSPPFVPVDGIPNFRDLGGYPVSTKPNHSVRQGIIYRCAEPSQVTPDGVGTLTKLGITHAYDLRSNDEIERAVAAGRGGVTAWDGCKRVFAPVFTDQDYSPEVLAVRFKDYATLGTEGFVRAYTSILENAPPSYSVILSHLAHEPSKPLLLHCTAGKDRTGVICALVLSVCGVDDNTVAKEYALTEIGLSRQWKESVIEHLSVHPALHGNMEGAWNMISAKAENMLAVLKVVGEKYGSAEGYMIENCRLTKEEIEMIKSNLIIEGPLASEKVQHSL